MSDTTPRDQLAQIIRDGSVEHFHEDYGFGLFTTDLDRIIDAILSAGWRPPARTVTEVTELEELPVRSVVADKSGLVLVCLGHRYANVVGNVWASEHGEWHLSRNLRLPVVVLREREGE